MGRRELREEIQSTWATYTPRVPGTPFTKRDLEDATERFETGEASPEEGVVLPTSPSRAHWCATLSRMTRR